MSVMPVSVSCDSHDLCGFPQSLFKFACESFLLEPSPAVIFPHCGSQHGGLGIVGKASGFDGGVNVFEVLKFLHPAPKFGARGQLGLGSLFCKVCLVGGIGELGHEEEDGENEDVVDPQREVEPQLAPWPVFEFVLKFFDGLLPRRGNGRRSNHKSKVSPFSGPCVVGVWVPWLCREGCMWCGFIRVRFFSGVVFVVLIVLWMGGVAEGNGNGFRGVDVHRGDVAVSGHDFVELFRVSVPRWDGNCRVIGEGPDGGFPKALVDDA